MIRAGTFATLALAGPAGAFEMAFPLDCTLGENCHIQQFFDHQPGPLAHDFTCGPLSYDGHDGTDFALPSRDAMQTGVAVLAAGPGRVRGMRDGIADFAPKVDGKECGNGVVIEHEDGWETQYCHMKQGSVAVVAGMQVQTGTVLGLVGQSGMADFPHMHLAVRHRGKEIDPFAPDAKACGATEEDLWADEMPVQPGGLLSVGIADRVPAYDEIKAGLPSPPLNPTTPALVVWGYFFGPRAGDTLLMSLNGPEGSVVQERVQLEKTQAMAFRAVGRRLTAAAWPAGAYRGEVIMMRGPVEIDRHSITITVRP